jgi:hypothetical protein
MSEDRLAEIKMRLAEIEGRPRLYANLSECVILNDAPWLVAEIERLRTELVDAMGMFWDQTAQAWMYEEYGPTLVNKIQGLAGYYELMGDEQDKEIERLRAENATLAKETRLWLGV